MTTPNPMVPESPIAQRSGPRIVPAERFPRRGAFCIVAGQLGIIASVGKRGDVEIDGVSKPYVDDAQPFAEVHLVQTNEKHPNYGHFRRAPENFPGEDEIGLREPIGEVQERGGEIFNVPFDQIERAPWSVVGSIVDKRNGDDPKPDLLWASRAGYVLGDDEQAQLPALLKAEEDEKERTAYIAAHPEATALEEEIERDRVAFIQAQAAKRQELATRLLADRAPKPEA